MELSNLSKAFKALSNEQRLRLFQLLSQWEKECLKQDEGCCSSGIEKAFSRACEELDLAPSTISHHFKELQNAGLILCCKKGQYSCCHVNQEVLTELKDFLIE